MSDVTRKHCDVYPGEVEGVAPVNVKITTRNAAGDEAVLLLDVTQDMCPKAFARLCKFARSGLRPSTPRKRDAKPERTPPAEEDLS